MKLAILDLKQMTRLTPALECCYPNFHATLTKGRMTLDIAFSMYHIHLHCSSKVDLHFNPGTFQSRSKPSSLGDHGSPPHLNCYHAT
ncbi:hypothetical protein AVEN_68228-1 [Araneus ventricosus]|uniref:Uncharacterized protein n=1 Tax=Araneus ventricosus TaxID=182803 RepID=A0A4Y2X367_ARAVE|nr:hypothetical protein AVEN_247796-1 [Araneus ventricosus]GBO44133.1 hypothetical protein AVEN_269491-1 [Araneus ventricosus]GBO44134.1 hypothetical protein AVEN_66394-1 [Araneus ventricosus]GBO44135.1 hypothetical protein AVEN_68228-1 [Araneus ventricosus]